MPVSVGALTVVPAVSVQNEGKLMADPRRHTRGSDTRILYPGPINSTTGVVLDSVAGASATLHLFDGSLESVVAVGRTRIGTDAAMSATSIVLPHFTPQWINAGDTIEIVMDNGWTHTTTVTGVTVELGSDTIGLASGLAYQASAGNRVSITSKASVASTCPITSQQRELYPGLLLDVVILGSGAIITPTILQVTRIQADELDSSGNIVPAPNQERFLTMTTTAQFGAVLPAGSRIRVRVNASIAMTQYGTAVAGADDWGWQGVVPSSFYARLGSTVEAEVRFNGGSGLVDVKRLHLAIV